MGALSEARRTPSEARRTPSEARGTLAGRSIGVYASAGAPWHHLALAAVHGAAVRPVRAEDVAAGRLDELDVLVVPGGGATAMAGLLAPLGPGGTRAIRRWVGGGGTYVSSCAGSVLPLALTGEADAALPLARHLRMVDVPLANPGGATLGGLSSPGVGRIEVRLDPGHPLTGPLPEHIELVHYNGPLFDLRAAPAGVRAFAWPTAGTAAFTPAERFLPGDAAASDGGTGTVLEGCIAAGAATAIDANYGAGRVLLFGSHPEFGLGPLLLGWGRGAALLVAALADRDGHAPTADASRRDARVTGDVGWGVRREHADRSAAELAAGASRELRRASERFERLAELPLGAWLDEEHAASFHGRDARRAWRDDTAAAARVASAAALDLAALARESTPDDAPWLDDAPRPGQDFGAMGLVQMLRRIHDMLDAAAAAAAAPPRRPAHAYDLFDAHPYHLGVASYLSAAGLTAAALLTVVVIAARRGAATPGASPLLFADGAVSAAPAGSAPEGGP